MYLTTVMYRMVGILSFLSLGGESLYTGAYVSVLAGGGCSFKIRPTYRSIDDTIIQLKFVRPTHISVDDTLIQPKFVGWLSRAIKSKIFCRSTVKVASI